MKEEYEMLKRELSVERNKVSHLQQEKESAYDEIHTLKEQCELLSSRLGDPERSKLFMISLFIYLFGCLSNIFSNILTLCILNSLLYILTLIICIYNFMQIHFCI